MDPQPDNLGIQNEVVDLIDTEVRQAPGTRLLQKFGTCVLALYMKQLLDAIFTVGDYTMFAMYINSAGVQLEKNWAGLPK